MFRLLCLSLIALSSAATAQDRRPSHCIAIADAAPGISYVQTVSFSDPVPAFSVRLTYVDHAMFLLQTPGGLSVITDYSGFIGPTDFVPDVVTMNNAHETHFTNFPDPRIPHVLQGWGNAPLGIDHYLDLGEMLIRNVSTDIRSRFGGGVVPNGNSIFVFEVEGLCIGHLGHLHHEPNDAAIRGPGAAGCGDGGSGWRDDAADGCDRADPQAAEIVGGDPDALVRALDAGPVRGADGG